MPPRAQLQVRQSTLANMLHTACDLVEAIFRKAGEPLGIRPRLFEHLRSEMTAYTAYVLCGSRHARLRRRRVRGRLLALQITMTNLGPLTRSSRRSP